jgi:hypothetical protein
VQETLKDALDILFQRRRRTDPASELSCPSKKLQMLPSSITAAADHAVERNHEADDSLQGSSLFVFGSNNRLRRLFAAIIWHPRFEQVIIVLICLSSITLALDSPRRDPDGAFKTVLVRYHALR